MAQTFRELARTDIERLDRQRNWILGYFHRNAEKVYASLDGKLLVVDAILKNGWVAPDETWKLQSVGVAFGDALVQRLGLAWMIVEDEYGCDPILKDPGSALNLCPLTMMSKRVEHGETFGIRDLFQALCGKVSDMRRQQHEAGERESSH